MALLASYHLPGLFVEDRSIEVPLDWRGTTPARLAGCRQAAPDSALLSASAAAALDPALEGRSLSLFYRVVCAPENVGRDLPYLVFLQGGPGGAGPRLTSPTSDGWVAEAVRHFCVILPDQRGTGRSSRVDGVSIAREGDAAAQARFLKCFLADSIVRDFEYLRLTELGGARWVTLGQSYGGFLTLTYLSTFPGAACASFTCGGIPHVPASADEVYAHTFGRMASKTRLLYERYPEDERRVGLLADRLAAGEAPVLPDGSPMTVRRLQSLGQGLGMKPGHERLHNLLDLAFSAGDGSADAALAAAGGDVARVEVSDAFLAGVWSAANVRANPLYWVLQELIYADGELDAPIAWAAERAWQARSEFSEGARPFMLTGEACFPWMFEQQPELASFAGAMDALMADTSFGRLYDEVQLAANETPLTAAVYFDDLYVDSGLQLDTLSRVGASHAWVTNEFEHDGLHGDRVFKHLLGLARDRGDLDGVL
ncbi:alpha/beta fold hydrolase [Olsenella profusa]|uniref:Alpha/beta fold hydrolase n=1 Tax=Olsenella profusa TaxID=138595 RepID=A0ABS2EZ44_9ACTN|nr:alpha/beta fold hydrolase [Olsenella profusa]MBM6773991.1 alpha/beta fold hydrolase [Olsenella profusa]